MFCIVMHVFFVSAAASGGAANRDRGELMQGSGFYNFCRVYRIFPVLTSDSVVRRISQHVR
jgi:hypothetical protein